MLWKNEISFRNIIGLNSNEDQIHFHLKNSHPQMMLLTEAQINPKNVRSHIRCTRYRLHELFRFVGTLFAYIRNVIRGSVINISCKTSCCIHRYSKFHINTSYPRVFSFHLLNYLNRLNFLIHIIIRKGCGLLYWAQ